MKKSMDETLDQIEQRLVAQGCCTYSKRSDQSVLGVHPTHAASGGETGLWCNGRKYTDWVCGLGSNLDGYYNNYTYPSRLEPLVAELVKKRFPFVDKMKFLKTGSAACEAAVRIARAYKQKGDKYDIVHVAGLGYHGCSNIFIAEEQPGSGTRMEWYFKKESLEETMHCIELNPMYYGIVIVEPVMLSMNVKKELAELRRLCTKHDIVLIFDEIITGYRFPKYCASSYFGIYPDIICLGKAIANGYPLAIVAGKEKYIETPGYFISNTHNGEESGLRAALETMTNIDDKRINELWKRGKYFQTQFNKIWPEKITLVGIPTRATWAGDETVRAKFWQEMCKEDYIFGRAWFINFAHTMPVIERTLEKAREALRRIKAGRVRLEGPLPKPVFQRDVVKKEAR